MGKTFTALMWLMTRGLVLVWFFGPESWVTGDISYFADSLARLGDLGIGQTLVEYPLPGVALVAVPWLVAKLVGHLGLYSEIVMALALLTDAGFTLLLRRAGPGRRTAATWVWLLAVPLLGATTYARFDLVPGVLVGVAVLLLAAHPRLAAGCAAVATGLKLWPALVLPALAARARGRWPVLAVIGAVGLVLVGGSVALAGWSRLVSPLTWQADRGLQIESVLATPAMIGWHLDPHALTVAYSDNNAFEVSGTGVPTLLMLTDVLGVLLVVSVGVLWWRSWRQGATLSAETTVWLALTAVTGFMVSSKVLSPQYMLWLLPAAAAGLAVSESRDGRLVRWAVVLLVATGLTHLVFPTFYGGLVQHSSDSARAVALLTVRNVLMVSLLVWAWVETWRHLRDDAQRGIELERQPAGPDAKDTRTLR